MSYMIVTDDALESTIIKGPWDSTAPDHQPKIGKLFKKFHSNPDLDAEHCKDRKESAAKRAKTTKRDTRDATTKMEPNITTAASNVKAKRSTVFSTDFNPQSDSLSCDVQSSIPDSIAEESSMPPPPALEQGISLYDSSADINAAINKLVQQLNKHADHVTIIENIQNLRRAEKNQAQIVQAMTQQMNEMRAQIAAAENKKRTLSQETAKVEPKVKPPGFDRSFIVRTINSIIKDHPEISPKLTVVKDILQEHESNVRQEQIDLEADTHEKMFVLLTEQKKFEATIRSKDDMIHHCYESMDKWEKECEANEQEIACLKDRLHKTEYELKQAVHDRNANHHDQSKAIIRLEREKTSLVEANNLLEQTLATERLKVINAENVKKIAMKYSGEVKESYDFYRAFYEKQTSLYDQYFAPRGTEIVSEDSKMTLIDEDTQSDKSSNRCPVSKLKFPLDFYLEQARLGENVTKALRIKYREQLENSDLPQGKSSKSSLSGSEFLAMVDTRRVVSAPGPPHPHRISPPLPPRTPSMESDDTTKVEGTQEAESSSYYESSSSEFVRGGSLRCSF